MANHFQWQPHTPAPGSVRKKNGAPPDRFGWWVIVSLLTAIIIHIGLFISMGHVKFYSRIVANEEDTVTGRVAVRPVDEAFEEPRPEPAPPEETPLPKPDQTTLLDDVEILEQLKEPELEMKPTIEQASFDVAVKIENPALAGDPTGDITKMTSNAIELSDSELDTLGTNATVTPTAADGQIIVDPGRDLANNDTLNTAMEDLIKRGAAGQTAQGLPDGTTSLNDIVGLPTNVLVTKTTMLPSDLLFEFNSDQLRPSSRVGMQKIALVMDLNPELYCWIDGHTDLIGTDAANDDLSQRRAQSVKNYLIGIGMPAGKIITRGFGERNPIILDGDQNQQAGNRRVELKIRKTLPPPPPRSSAEQEMSAPRAITQAPPKAALAAEEIPLPDPTEPAPPKAQPVRVKPMRAIPVQETPAVPPIARAQAAPEPGEANDPAIESGTVEEISPLRAQPAEE